MKKKCLIYVNFYNHEKFILDFIFFKEISFLDFLKINFIYKRYIYFQH